MTQIADKGKRDLPIAESGVIGCKAARQIEPCLGNARFKEHERPSISCFATSASC